MAASDSAGADASAGIEPEDSGTIDDRSGMEFDKAMKEEIKRSIEHSASVSAESVEEARKQVTARGRDQQG